MPSAAPPAWRSRIVGSAEVAPDQLLANPANWRTHPFSGSGTTLMAAETLDRRCLAMELEPRYAQVAIERWQAFTGQKALRLDG